MLPLVIIKAQLDGTVYVCTNSEQELPVSLWLQTGLNPGDLVELSVHYEPDYVAYLTGSQRKEY